VSAVFIVIVNYRTASLVVDCLASLEAQVPVLRGGRVIVVDNASGDGSVQEIHAAAIRHAWNAWLEVLELPRNGGFAYGNNAGIRRVREIDPAFRAVVMLNPDTVAQPGALECLVSFFTENPEAGIAGARIESGSGFVETSAHADPSPRGELHGGAQLDVLVRWLPLTALNPTAGPQRCDWVSGACMAVRREVFDAAGPLDEEFFLYFEEVDYCVRARQLGWQCWYVPQARVVHFEGASTGIRTAGRRRPAYWYASRRRFFVKRYGVAGLLAADLLWGLGRSSLVLRRLLGLGGRAGIRHEPSSVASDLLIGDLKALFNGDLWRIKPLQTAAVARR
jgi:GT2 family glycosyltransferase